MFVEASTRSANVNELTHMTPSILHRRHYTNIVRRSPMEGSEEHIRIEGPRGEAPLTPAAAISPREGGRSIRNFCRQRYQSSHVVQRLFESETIFLGMCAAKLQRIERSFRERDQSVVNEIGHAMTSSRFLRNHQELIAHLESAGRTPLNRERYYELEMHYCSRDYMQNVVSPRMHRLVQREGLRGLMSHGIWRGTTPPGSPRESRTR